VAEGEEEVAPPRTLSPACMLAAIEGSHGGALLPCPCVRGVAWLGVLSRAPAMSGATFFFPRGGDAAAVRKPQVGPLSLGLGFGFGFFSDLKSVMLFFLFLFPDLDLHLSKASDTIVMTIGSQSSRSVGFIFTFLDNHTPSTSSTGSRSERAVRRMG
jgi:hypothetical protein